MSTESLDHALSEIRFGLKTQIVDDDDNSGGSDGQEVLVSIRLRYEVGCERPSRDVEDSVVADSEDLGEEDLADLRRECRAFHDLPLSQAIKKALC